MKRFFWTWLESVWQDARYVVRTCRWQPGFATAVLLTLALGIGANAAIFSVVDAVLLKPAPYPQPERIVIFGYTFQGAWVPWSSPAKFNVWRRHDAAIQDMAAIRFRQMNVTGGSDPEQVPAAEVNAGFFKLFGAAMAEGRTFTGDEDRPDGGHAVVLSYGFWQRRFGGEPGTVGRSIALDGTASLVVGILGPSFDTTIFNASPDVWLPLQLDPHSTAHPPSLRAAARLRPGITLDVANTETLLAGAEFRRQFPDATGPTDTFRLASFQDVMVGDVRPSLLVLLAAVGLVLLIACGNVANLILVRASVRRRELAIRAAIGASRGRIVRQLLTESLVLSLTGGALGLTLGSASVRVLLFVNHGDLPRIGPHGAGISLDWRVVTFTLVVAITTALVFGIAPALQASRAGLGVTLTEGGGRTGTSRRALRARSLLVMTEMALAIVLLVGAALLIRTFAALGTVNRGFSSRDVLTMRMALTGSRLAQTSGVVQLARDGVQRVSALPGVTGAGAAVSLPLESDWLTSFTIAGRPPNGRPPGLASFRIISPGFLAALQIPLIRGRAFTDRDDGGAPPVAIINAVMARQISPGGDPLNDWITQFPGLVPADDPPRQIIGVAGDVRDGLALSRQTRPTVYVPMAQVPAGHLHAEPLAWVIRTQTDPHAVSAAAAKELQQASGGLPVTKIRTMDAVSSDATARTRFQMVLMAIFGAVALVLAAIGVYGVMAFTVQQRAHEIGVRLALGAEARDVRNMVIVEGMRVAVPGILVGIASAFALAHLLDDLLFDVTAHDPLVFVSVPLLLTMAALVAVWLPGHVASRVDPGVALRSE
jgi:putative ABC transport system permease protein